RDRLFADHVLAGFEGRDGDGQVQRRRQADVDQVDLRIGDQVLPLFVASDVAQFHDGARRAEVALNPAPVAGEFLFVASADRGYLGASHLLVGQVMDHAHEADADDSDSYHWCDSW